MPASRSETTDQDRIVPKELLEKHSVEEFNHYSNEYYKQMPQPEQQLGKPFAIWDHAPQHLLRLGLMLESLRVEPGIKVLDFGAGTCWIAKSLWQMGCSVIATDVSEEALRLGARLFSEYPVPNRPQGTWEMRLFDGHRLPLEDGEVDRIICFDTFHHVPNQKRVIEEFYRVLRMGGTIVMNEPLGPHSSTPEAQSEMRTYTVLENDLDMPAMRALFLEAGFEGPSFKVAAAPGYMLNYDEWLQCKAGQAPASMTTAIMQFQQNMGVFYFQKGAIRGDSRQPRGLAHNLKCSPLELVLKAHQPQQVTVHVTNVGDNRWLHTNDRDYGVVRIGTRLLDFETRELVLDHNRFALGRDMAPGDEFAGDIPIGVAEPGRYWLKIDLVSEFVCWFEQLGSTPVLLEVNVEP